MQQQRYRKQDQESARTSHGFHGDWSKSPKFTSWGSSAQAEAATKHRRKEHSCLKQTSHWALTTQRAQITEASGRHRLRLCHPTGASQVREPTRCTPPQIPL